MAIALLDGGLGTSLQDKFGVVFNASTPLWASHLLVSDPDTLLACQRDFVSAGIDVLLTATYQVSIEGFARTKTAQFPNGIPRDAIAPFLRTALDVAEQAVSSKPGTKIALSLGPYGACMIPGQEYSGKYDAAHDSEEALYRWHRERLQLFLDADDKLLERVQYIAFETLPRLDEVRAVRRAMHALRLATPFWIACVFPGEVGDDALPDGSDVEKVVTAAVADTHDGARPWGIGINCTKIAKLPGLVERLGEFVRKTASVPTALVLYPDGTNGEVYNTTTQEWEKREGQGSGQGPWEVQLAAVVREACDKGAFQSFLVGGCCKATHEDVRRLHGQFRN
jgi:homocysteine S-methyltransferase